MENNLNNGEELTSNPISNNPVVTESVNPEILRESVLKDFEVNQEVNYIKDIYEKTKNEIQKVIVGNDDVIKLLLAGMFTGGHVLMEGAPGVAKTLIAKLISQCFHIDFKRIQFTPDLMPSDLIGVTVFNLQKSEFTFKKGPVFSNLILIDEINRSPAKTQAALFEAMEEKQVTVDGISYELGTPFFVIATQNPIDQEGTYKLPEAQLDRFLFKLKVNYPDLKNEIDILKRFQNDFNQKDTQKINHVMTPDAIGKSLKIIEKIHIKDELLNYIATIVYKTRNNGNLYMGASPRASMAIMKTAKAMAAIHGRDFVSPDDIQSVCYPVLNHRIILSPEKEMEGVTVEHVIKEIIQNIEVPR
ncbi:MAG: MoxR family ATPase [Bacteroidetes bacterium]|nr:MoxR family ATPase [Bacteroidota bacterium]